MQTKKYGIFMSTYPCTYNTFLHYVKIMVSKKVLSYVRKDDEVLHFTLIMGESTENLIILKFTKAW